MLLKTEGYRQRSVNSFHSIGSQMSHLFTKSGFVKRTYLLKQNHRIFRKTEAICGDVDMCRKMCLIGLAGYSGGNHGRAVTVTDVVLNDYYGTDTSLLRADNGTQVRVKNIPTFYSHTFKTPFFFHFYFSQVTVFLFKKQKTPKNFPSKRALLLDKAYFLVYYIPNDKKLTDKEDNDAIQIYVTAKS